MSVFLVWFGEYSDKMVVAACSTEEKAQALADAFPFECRVEETKLDPPTPGADGLWPYDVYFTPNGDVADCRRMSTPWGWHDPQSAVRSYFGGVDDHVHVHTRARDDAGAIKSAADLRAQLIASEVRA